MRDSAAPTYVGLDIGTSAVRCVVGARDVSDPANISVIGHGCSSNQGMRKGVVMHIEDAAEAIIQAITEAERISGVQIHQATVNVNGGHVTGINSRGVIAISSPNREISVETASVSKRRPPLLSCRLTAKSCKCLPKITGSMVRIT